VELSQRFAWRGRDVAWERRGTGPAVVFCHGTPWSSRLWAPYAEALAADHTVHLWDMPGYGQSSMRADHAVDLGVQGELFADLLTHWKVERPHVIAHDIGGAVALRARLLHDATYASLALVDVVALRPWGRRTSGWWPSTPTCSRRCRRPSIAGRSRRTCAVPPPGS
jgi:pimeloyl-ACP methyl ester carboxylesterase